LQGYPILQEYLEKKYTAERDTPDSEYTRLEKRIREKANVLGTDPAVTEFFLRGLGLKNENPVYLSHWNRTSRALDELKKLSNENGFCVVVVIYPLLKQMDKYPLDVVHEFLRRELSQKGLDSIDLQTDIKQLYQTLGCDAITGDGVHFTPMAAQKAAEILYPEIKIRIGACNTELYLHLAHGPGHRDLREGFANERR
jgi:hypothetical protein